MKLKTYASVVTLALTGLLGWVALSGGFQTSSVHAQTTTTFNNLSIRGTYGFNFSGSVNTDTPIVGYGVMTADGVGGVTGRDCIQSASTGGFICRDFVGLYTVNTDGTGSVQMDFTDASDDNPLPRAARFNFVVVDGARQIRSIQMDSGIAVSAEFHRQ